MVARVAEKMQKKVKDTKKELLYFLFISDLNIFAQHSIRAFVETASWINFGRNSDSRFPNDPKSII